MKKITSVIIMFILSFSILKSQGIIYLDENNNPSDFDNAKYYQTIKYEGDSAKIKIYFLSNDQLRAELSQDKSSEKLKGKSTWYYENGNLEMEVNYANDKRIGFFKSYYENGSQKVWKIYDEAGNEKVIQFWDNNGQPKLIKGSGEFTEFNFTTNSNNYYSYVDSVLVDGYSERLSDSKRFYLVLDTQAEPVIGMENFYKKIRKKLKYPFKAVMNDIQGVVFIQFVIEKDGSITEPKVIKGAHPLLDEEALRTFNKLKTLEWKPATYKNENVAELMVIPINFQF